MSYTAYLFFKSFVNILYFYFSNSSEKQKIKLIKLKNRLLKK